MNSSSTRFPSTRQNVGRFARLTVIAVYGVVLAAGFAAAGASAGDVAWKRISIEAVFRSEGVTAFDVNKDGLIDVVNGEAWFQAPDWTRHEIRPLGEYKPAEGYSHSFANFAYDFNNDGWTDFICIDFPGIPCYWFENPQGQSGHWKQHEIWHSAANESPQFADVTGDGKPELIIGSEPEEMIGYLEIPTGDAVYKKWDFRQVNAEKIGSFAHRYYHGLGVGDVNNDGRKDIVIPHGFWQQPETLGGPWAFHPLTLGPGEGNAKTASDIHVEDLDGDGDNDIMLSSAHEIGVWWCENVGGNAEPKFKGYVIDDKYSQTHALCFADIDGDGTRDLITGKRFYAHGPNGDPDPQGEVVMYWYGLKKTAGKPPSFEAHKIVEGIDTGIGTQFLVTDVNADGKLDIVLSNKKGTNLLIQQEGGK